MERSERIPSYAEAPTAPSVSSEYIHQRVEAFSDGKMFPQSGEAENSGRHYICTTPRYCFLLTVEMLAFSRSSLRYSLWTLGNFFVGLLMATGERIGYYYESLDYFGLLGQKQSKRRSKKR